MKGAHNYCPNRIGAEVRNFSLRIIPNDADSSVRCDSG